MIKKLLAVFTELIVEVPDEAPEARALRPRWTEAPCISITCQ